MTWAPISRIRAAFLLPSFDQSPAEYRQCVVMKFRQRGVQRQDRRQVEVVLALGQRLDAETGAVEEWIWHGSILNPKFRNT